jgi:hypothetical protein
MAIEFPFVRAESRVVLSHHSSLTRRQTMDPKKARETLKRLCAEWDRAGQLMNRYVRPAGFSLALGVGIVTGAACSSTVSSDRARDALPPAMDAYGVDRGQTYLDGPSADAKDVPIPLDGRVDIVDSANDVPLARDAYGIADARLDIVDSAREALPPLPDAYGVFDRPPIPRDGLVDIVDSAREALPPLPDAYGVFDRPPIPRDGGVDSPAVDAADAPDATLAPDGADGGARD